MNNVTACGYDELESALRAAGAVCTAAESHGVLCGLICANGNTPADVWQEHLLGVGNTGSASAKATDLLTKLFTLSRTRFKDTDPGLELLLPDDDVSLPVRSRALGEWCQGFLYGLALGGVGKGTGAPGHVAEILHDLYEISHAGSATDSDNETEEAAYLEITEYVRICVLLCHEELRSLPPAARL